MKPFNQEAPLPPILRRLGPDPHANGARTPAVRSCPDIFELESGDFAIIGIDITAKAVPNLPESAGCGPDERVVWVPRTTLVNARADIPGKLYPGLVPDCSEDRDLATQRWMYTQGVLEKAVENLKAGLQDRSFYHQEFRESNG